MKRIVIVIASLVLLLVGSSICADQTSPNRAGVFYKSAAGLVELRQVQASSAGMKKMGRMFVPGLTPHFVQVFNGAHAPVKVGDRRPLFMVSGPIVNVMGRNFQIVRLEAKKDRRELQTTSGSTAFTMKAGYGKGITPEIESVFTSSDLMSITPTHDLDPGEYAVVMGMASVSIYDFTVE